MELENITDNMNFIGHEGKWYSYVSNLDLYRIRLLDDEYTIWLGNDTGQTLIDTPESKSILRTIKASIL